VSAELRGRRREHVGAFRSASAGTYVISFVTATPIGERGGLVRAMASAASS
jgi:hypothetical protein